MDELTVNITLKIHKNEVVSFENWLHQQLEVISFNHIRDTAQMYKDDKTFKKLVKNVKEAQRVKDDYASKNNHKYLNK